MKTLTGIYTYIKRMVDPMYALREYDRWKLKLRWQTIDIQPVSADTKRKIKELWGRTSPWFDFYNTIGDKEKVHLYFPDTWFFQYIDAKLNNWKLCAAIDDKSLYDHLFDDVRRPKTIIKICNGIFLDERSRIISLADAVAACRAAGNVIIKPTYNVSGGKGIVFWKEGCDVDLEDILRHSSDEVVQEVIEQHPTLAQIHADSINTLRIISMTTTTEVKILSAILRMGIGKSKVDNISSGGIATGIDEEGRLKGKAFSISAKSYDKHPDGAELAGVQIPGFHECLDIIKATAPRFARYSRLTSWDFAIGSDGKPIFIEANLCHSGIDQPQMCNGPILGDEETTRYMVNKYIK